MPRRKTKRKTKKRAVRRRQFQGVPSGMPTQRVARLRYAETLQMTSTAGALSSQVYRANGIFDPNYTGTGHQPMGFDQWAGLFNHYVVLGAKCTVTFANKADAAYPAWTGVLLTDSTTSPYTAAYEYIEAQKGTIRDIPADPSGRSSIRSNYSTKKFYNVTDVKDNLSRLGSAVTADPTDQALFHVWYQSSLGGTQSVLATVTIDYIVSFSEPKDLASS